MKRNTILSKKICVLPVLVLVIAQLMSVFAFADAKEFISWTMSLDCSVIEGNGRTYTKYEYADVEVDALDVYQYAGNICPSSGEEYKIYAPSHDSELIWIQKTDMIEIYATEEGRADIESFLRGEGEIFRISNSAGQKGDIEAAVVSTMNASDKTREIDVRELRAAECYEILAYDATDALSYKYGAVFSYGGEFLFVRYSELANNCFDADGNLSFRSGTLSMKALDGETVGKIKLASENMSYRSAAHHYENISDATPAIPKAFFWLCCLFVGFVLPLPMLALGLILPRFKLLSRPRAWYSLAILALAWMALSAALMVLLLI